MSDFNSNGNNGVKKIYNPVFNISAGYRPAFSAIRQEGTTTRLEIGISNGFLSLSFIEKTGDNERKIVRNLDEVCGLLLHKVLHVFTLERLVAIKDIEGSSPYEPVYTPIPEESTPYVITTSYFDKNTNSRMVSGMVKVYTTPVNGVQRPTIAGYDAKGNKIAVVFESPAIGEKNEDIIVNYKDVPFDLRDTKFFEVCDIVSKRDAFKSLYGFGLYVKALVAQGANSGSSYGSKGSFNPAGSRKVISSGETYSEGSTESGADTFDLSETF